MASFGAFWELILLQLHCLSYTHKPVSLLWLVKPAIASLCQKVGGCMTVLLGLKSGGHVPLSPCWYATDVFEHIGGNFLYGHVWQLKTGLNEHMHIHKDGNINRSTRRYTVGQISELSVFSNRSRVQFLAGRLSCNIGQLSLASLRGR